MQAPDIFASQEKQTRLRALVTFLLDEGHRRLVERFFERYWATRRRKFEEILVTIGGTKPAAEKRTKALEVLLETEGFMPHIVRGPGKTIRVEECNCPFPEAIKATRIPCRLESKFIEWALDLPVQRTSYIPHGEAACEYTKKEARETSKKQ